MRKNKDKPVDVKTDDLKKTDFDRNQNGLPFMDEVQTKTTALNEVGQEPEPKKRRRRRKVDVEELPPMFTPERLKLMRQGLLYVLEGVTRLPYTKTDVNLIDQLDMALSEGMNQYFPRDWLKYYPLFQIGLVFSLITIDAYAARDAERVDEMKTFVDTTKKSDLGSIGTFKAGE